MKRNVPFVLTCLTIAVVMLLATASAQAGGKDKRSFKMKSKSSSGPSAMNFSPNKSTFSATPQKLNFNTGGNSGNNSGSNQFKSFKNFNTKKLNNSAVGSLSNKNRTNLNQFQSLGQSTFNSNAFNKSLANRKFNGTFDSALSNSAGKNGIKLRSETVNPSVLTEAFKAGRFKNGLQNNFANQAFPKDLTDIGRNNIADQIRNPNFGDLFADNGAGPGNGGPGNGGPGDGAPGDADPGNGGPGNGGPGDDGDQHDHDGHHDRDCHFPWWPPIIIGGGYHDHCYPGNYGGGYCPPVNNITVVEQPITTVAPAVQPFADLELLDVRFVDAGDPARNLGLRYRIVFRNRGTLPVGNFQVLVMASTDGTPQPGAPTATAEVITLAAGEVLSADVRLSVSADIATMNALIVALDSAVQVTEIDEQNNVAVLDRSKIAAADLAAIGTP